MSGVRQGENLSPLLYAIFLKDLEAPLKKKDKSVVTFKERVYTMLQDDDCVMYLNLCVLYANDNNSCRN